MSDTPAFQSETYYDVVLGTGTYLGWRCVFAGDGTLIFRHANGNERRFGNGSRSEWLRPSWEAFTEMATSESGRSDRKE
jgi:hypothetical protein